MDMTFKTLQKRSLQLMGLSVAAMSVHSLAAPLVNSDNLSVGIEVAYPPFESYQGDKVVGFDPELATLLANKMDIKPHYLDTKFTSLILGLQSNKFDVVISGMYILPDRLKKADAIPYAKTGALILTLKDAKYSPKTEKGLCGLHVGLQQGTTWVQSLTKLSDSYCVANGKKPISISEFPTAPEVSQALMSRNIDVQVEIAGAAHMFAERSRGRLVISSPDLIYPQTMGMYLKKGNTELKHKLEVAMAEIKADGSYQSLIKKYDLSPIEN
ncbi:amino acid ABC transporter substrate-binding protein [Vibrio sp. NFV-1]|uniref:Amino acid ABC transporter substrate-binding protein n=2 Tax=Vibrio nitrifigilis TaxID=2789781 RepID=A0ABS0GD38_9VIBR|nr:amino acid ABC transporter substrate-binding protein [Vibrio nitrifigilis]